MQWGEKTKHKNILLLTLVVLFMAFLPYMNDFLILGHDVQFHLGRIEGLAKSIACGEWMGRLNISNNYGYISGVMYPQIFLYIPAIMRLLGVSLVHCYKFFIFLINLVTVVHVYMAVRGIFGKQYSYTAFLASAFYTLSIYRLLNIYLRAALGEVLAMAFLPILFWGMYELLFRDSKKWYIAVWGWTGVLQSHLITTELCLLASVAVFLIFAIKICKKERIFHCLEAAVVTIMLNLFFLVPFLEYFLQSDFHAFHMELELQDTTIYFSQLFANQAKNSSEVVNSLTTVRKMPLTIGFLGVGIIVAYMIVRINSKEKRNLFGDVVFIGALCLIFAVSWLFPWGFVQRIPVIGKIFSTMQFTYRWLGLLSVFLTILFAVVINELQLHLKKTVVVGMAILLIAANYWYYLGDTIAAKTMSEDEAETSTAIDSLYLDEAYPSVHELNQRGETLEFIPQTTEAKCSNFEREGYGLSVDILDCTDTVDLEVPLYYYPGYTATLNGKPLEIEQGTSGVIRVRNITTDGKIEISFCEKTEWKIATFLSFLTLLVLLYYQYGNRLRERFNNKH